MKPEKCTVCGGALVTRYPEAHDPLTGEAFAVADCTWCGLGHTSPQPDDLGRYYGHRYYGNRHGLTLRHCISRRLGFIAAALPGKPGRRLLDIGCADGSFLLAARHRGWDVVGTELDPRAARQEGLDVKEDIAEFREDATYDCITMWHTLEHMRDIPHMLNNVARLLKPEGRVIIAVPDFGGWQARLYGPKWLHVDVPRHLYHFTIGALRHALAGAGFTVQRTWHQEIEYDLLGWSQSALNYLMPEPNVFFETLTGKQGETGGGGRVYACLLGSLLTLLSLPVLTLSTLLGKGGTLIVVAAPTPRMNDKKTEEL
ncbi:class I SAM-dependent methyltransferase [Geomonas agri]|uniref:class I SAM-dependent methyltransferase n=1 Tax=Geomonas agri TaxID=2873702 RepID=UPI001CD1F5E4|nr:class I SAM-dependent methyltransferase [Geomonas agri]